MTDIPTSTIMAILTDQSTNAQEIAGRHGISHQTVRLYKMLQVQRARIAAALVLAEGELPILWPAKRTTRQFTDEQVRAIRESKDDSGKLSKFYGCSSSMIRMIRLGQSYAEVK